MVLLSVYSRKGEGSLWGLSVFIKEKKKSKFDKYEVEPFNLKHSTEEPGFPFGFPLL